MTPRRCGPWGRPFGRGRPLWWPEGEPWPPASPPGGEPWRRARGYLLRRAAWFFAVVVALLVGLVVLVLWGTAVTPAGAAAAWVRPGRAILVLVLAALVVRALWAGRSFRAAGALVADVLEAFGRVADGEYAARVREHGPPEMRALARGFNAAAARLERQNRQRRVLLADISHELRTPLAVLQGNLEGMLDGVYPRDDAHLAATLDEIQVLARLVEDLRTLTLAEGLELALHRTPTDLADLARDALASFESRAAGAGVALGLAADPGLPAAEVDPERIHQVLANLLSNALRHTPAGGSVRVRCAADGPDRVAVAVEDTGTGIPPVDLPHVFDRFYKGKGSDGTGLGLAIAKSLVAAHGGEITARSAPGEGAVIRFTVPVHARG